MKLILIFFMSILTRVLTTNTIKYGNVLRKAIVFNDKMKSVYIDDKLEIDNMHKNSIYSMEHILPRSHISKVHYNDMHNIARTLNEMNLQRSNYKYTDTIDDCDKWKQLSYDNYVNHKRNLFIPNTSSRGIIARSLLYMKYEYKYNIMKVIDNDVLMKWFYDYPPSKSEIYHNEIVHKMQHKNNQFISQYNSNKKIKQLFKQLKIK